MTHHEQAGAVGDGSIELVIRPQEKDLGEFTVRRVLPSSRRRMVGPFIFFDHMGPAEFPPGEADGIEVGTEAASDHDHGTQPG